MDKDKEKSQSAARPASAKSSSAAKEEAILQYWKENDTFKKSLDKNIKGSASAKGFGETKEYVFYEGPPTANGKPGIHHLEARAFKDAIPRYKTMRGYHVRRKGGWDTHGLPVELQVEKKLGLASKKAIEEYGIAKFNRECKESVWEYIDLWEKFTDRIGYWVDQKNPYVTYHNDYIESVWNVIKQADKQKLLYKDYKVVPWCPRCETVLSSHELAQGYMDVKDLSVYVKFRIKSISPDAHSQVLGRGRTRGQTSSPEHTDSIDSNANTYILAWTTTPWTLPGNVALAVGKKIDYVKIKINNEYLILAKSRLSVIEGEPASPIQGGYEIVEELKGKDLIGLEYEPLYPYLGNTISGIEKQKLDKAFKVYSADFVTTEDGTGVVHTAVMYGVDDFVLGNEIGLPKHHMVGLDGKFLEGTDFLEGRFVRDEDVAVDIIKDLAHRGLLFKKEKYEHSYPHCWRCKTALIYYARDSWYIRMSSLRDKLVKENEGINWEPSYIKEGRFGEWLKDIKDWAISRERYWGSPLPVWTCDTCRKNEVLGSINEIKSKTKKSGNKYFVMRHGEADSNVRGILSSDFNANIHLTENGKKQVEDAIGEIRKMKLDYIFSSPIIRAQETTKIITDSIGNFIPVITDDRICEYKVGNFEGKPDCDYDKVIPNEIDKFTMRAEGSECFNDVKKRMASFIKEVESKYQNKNILIISHGDALWMLDTVNKGMTPEESINFSKENYLKNAEIKEFNFVPLPHNENYELDLHKPYIDEVELVCDCGGKLERTKEVMDVWLDSGTMPFSQDHYPFENKELVEKSYPADFICEAMDQTRGWFYTLHAVGAIMGKGKAYKNVICLGLLLDAKGKKMSKSLGNIVDPWEMMHKYGADTIRLWMYSVNQPGDPKSFDEKVVAELHNKVFNLLYNVLAFYELYRDKELESREKALQGRSLKEPSQGPSFEQGLEEANVLDRWIIARLNELTENMTKQLDGYKLLEPVRSIREFIDDLSTWYLRRSRDRLKSASADGSGATKDGNEAKATLYYVIKTLVKLMAPFAPFASEDIWQKLKNEDDVESVHLAEWPKIELKIKNEELIIKEMAEVRGVVTLGLQARQKAGIPVRQPLNELIINNYELRIEYEEIIKEELNIKNIKYVNGEELKVELDTKITEELKLEGQYRELVRAIQDIRKKNGLNPNDVITLAVYTDGEGQELVTKFEAELMKAVSAKEIQVKENEGIEIKIGELEFKVLIEK